MALDCDYKRWLRSVAGEDAAARLISDYKIGGCIDEATGLDAAVFWQEDIDGGIRTGKIMNFDPTTGKRLKGEASVVSWAHSLLRKEGALPEGWELTQCLYGEHLLGRYPEATVALVEAYKTAHVGAILMPEYVWVAVDSMSGLTAERLAPLRGRRVVLFPDEGRGFEEWSRRIGPISRDVGFEYRVSTFMEGRTKGSDIADLG